MTLKRFLVGVLVLLGIIVWVRSSFNAKDPETGEKKVMPVAAFDAKTDEDLSEKRVLVPEDPAKYGMVVIPSGAEAPQTPEEWEKVFSAAIEKSAVLETPEAKENLEKVKVSQEEYDKDVVTLENSIAKYKQRLLENPGDEDIKKHLSMLYQMKAIGNILKDKVVSP